MSLPPHHLCVSFFSSGTHHLFLDCCFHFMLWLQCLFWCPYPCQSVNLRVRNSFVYIFVPSFFSFGSPPCTCTHIHTHTYTQGVWKYYLIQSSQTILGSRWILSSFFKLLYWGSERLIELCKVTKFISDWVSISTQVSLTPKFKFFLLPPQNSGPSISLACFKFLKGRDCAHFCFTLGAFGVVMYGHIQAGIQDNWWLMCWLFPRQSTGLGGLRSTQK